MTHYSWNDEYKSDLLTRLYGIVDVVAATLDCAVW